MDPQLRTLLDAGGGMFGSARAHDLGVTDEAVAAAVRSGHLVRLRRGVLLDAALWESTPPWERHAVRARAVMLTMTSKERTVHALSHHSALALHGVPVFGVDDRAHLVRIDGVRARNGGMMAGHPPVDPAWAGTVDGLLVLRPGVATVQVAAAFGPEAGLVAADAALRTGAATPADLADGLKALGPGRHPAAPRLILPLADGRRESAGETRAWWLLRGLGLPEPELQVDVVARDGTFIGRPDFLWRGLKVIGEFDGALKYDSPGVLHAEKWRQDRFGDEGYEVFRLGWDDLDHPRRVFARATGAFARAAARRNRVG